MFGLLEVLVGIGTLILLSVISIIVGNFLLWTALPFQNHFEFWNGEALLAGLATIIGVLGLLATFYFITGLFGRFIIYNLFL